MGRERCDLAAKDCLLKGKGIHCYMKDNDIASQV